MTQRIAVYLYDTRNMFVGLGEFEDNLAKRIAAVAERLLSERDVVFYFIVPSRLTGHYGPSVRYIKMNRWRLFFLNWAPAKALRRWLFPRVDLVHFTQQLPKLHHTFSPQTLITVHDINFFHNHLPASVEQKKAKRIAKSLQRATHLSFISQFTSQDVRSHFAIDVPFRVIHNGVTNLSPLAERGTISIPANSLLHISHLQDKKNVHLLVEMMAQLPEYHLFLAGKEQGNYGQLLRNLIARHRLSNVTMLGPVSTEDKARLFRDCRAFLFPSLSEGFGLPVVEAMCFGKPAFLSRLTSLPEVGGDAAYYFDELHPAQMAQTVRAGLADFDRQRSDREAAIRANAGRFDWDKTARAFIDYYLSILQIKSIEL